MLTCRAQAHVVPGGHLHAYITNHVLPLAPSHRDVLDLESVFDCKPAIMRAWQAAKRAAKTKSRLGDDYVERIEFRLLLSYLRGFFELYQMFDRMVCGALLILGQDGAGACLEGPHRQQVG